MTTTTGSGAAGFLWVWLWLSVGVAVLLFGGGCQGLVGSPGDTTGTGGAGPGGGTTTSAGSGGTAVTPGGTGSGGSGTTGTGTGGSGTGSGGAPAPPLCASGTAATTPGPAPLGRLTDVEYRNTIRDLLPGVDGSAMAFPSEIATDGFTNNALAQSPSAELVEDLQRNAHALATAALASTSVMTALLPCHPTKTADEPACGQQFIQTFGKRAFRRPLRTEETTRYNQLFSTAYGTWGFQPSLRMIIEALLQAPGFLYRVELAGASGTAGLPSAGLLDQYETASRLSYLLVDTMPDDKLMAAADAGKLGTAAGIETEARRLIGTGAAHDAVSAFHAQWLRFGKMDTLAKAPDLFPTFSATMADAMKEATRLYIDDLFWSHGQTLTALLTDDHAYVNDVLAPLYGVTAPKGATLTRIAVDKTQRSGILTQVGLLAGFAHERADAPVLRGVFVLDRLLCQAPPAPPPGVNVALPDVDPGKPMTTRQQLETTHESGGCVGCHHAIDGVGFGFESYDALGQWRTTENGLAIDATGQLMGTTDADGAFNGAVELGQRLAGSDQVRSCVATQWLRYALGVTRPEVEACMVAPIVKAFADGSYDLRELLVALVKSDAFRYRPAFKP